MEVMGVLAGLVAASAGGYGVGLLLAYGFAKWTERKVARWNSEP